MRFITLILLFSILFSSCQPKTKYKAEINVAYNLVKALHDYDTIQIRNIVGVKPEDIGEDAEHFRFKVVRAHEILRAARLPDKTNYTIKVYPEESPDLLDITVPVGNKKEKITIRFVKFLPVGKVAFFQLDGPVIENRETIAPL